MLFIVFGALDASWSARIPLIRERLGLSDLALSVALTGPAIGLILAAQLAPAFVHRFGNVRASRLALVASAATLPAAALAPDLALLTLALTAWGTCLGTLEITMNAQGAALERLRGRSMLSGLHASYSTAVLLFAPIGSLAVTLHVSPFVHFAVIAGACVAAALPPSRWLMSVDTNPRSTTADRKDSLLRHPELLALASIGASAMLAEGSVVTWSGVLLRQYDHSSLAVAPFALMTFSAGMAVGRGLGDRVIMRLGHLQTAWRAAAVAAVGLGLAAGAPSTLLAIGGYSILGLGLSVLIPISFALSARGPGTSPVWALSRITTAVYVGLFVGPPLIGLLSSATSLPIALGAVAVLLALVSGGTIRWAQAESASSHA
jgi:predicted MFS family arabinose efflux permease